MKTLHNINKWSVIITLLLYTTIIGGLLAQILLGCIQFILGLVILSHWNNLSLVSKKLITTYWILFICYWIAHFIINTYSPYSFSIIFYVIIPMSIAIYFAYVTHQFQKASDELQYNNL